MSHWMTVYISRTQTYSVWHSLPSVRAIKEDEASETIRSDWGGGAWEPVGRDGVGDDVAHWAISHKTTWYFTWITINWDFLGLENYLFLNWQTSYLWFMAQCKQDQWIFVFRHSLPFKAFTKWGPTFMTLIFCHRGNSSKREPYLYLCCGQWMGPGSEQPIKANVVECEKFSEWPLHQDSAWWWHTTVNAPMCHQSTLLIDVFQSLESLVIQVCWTPQWERLWLTWQWAQLGFVWHQVGKWTLQQVGPRTEWMCQQCRPLCLFMYSYGCPSVLVMPFH